MTTDTTDRAAFGAPGTGVVALALAIALAGCAAPTATDRTEPRIEEAPMSESTVPADDADALRAATDAWHAEREERLRSDTGWLTLVGLHPLADGVERLGSGGDATIRLPDSARADVGTLAIDGESIRFTAAPGADVRVFEGFGAFQGRSVAMIGDANGNPTVLATGSVLFHVIDRGDARYLRVRDREAEALRAFDGIDRFPVDPEARVVATLVSAPSEIAVVDVRGNVASSPSPGTLVFTYAGAERRLRPTANDDGSLFIVFADATSGAETYGGGRFLSADAPDEDGRVTLDFNRAINPVCAFNAFATCPMPPAGNRLDVAVRAGERTPATMP